ncbi:MAG: hypothetical protein QOH91_2073, partial [Mycobacterium sp.]|nr:hypothetical protein [Mycobacterium sp.]
SHYVVRTDCLRTGDRCVSNFHDPSTTTAEAFIFANGTWTMRSTFDELTCSAGGTSHATVTATLPLPQPLQDPIPLLTGHGNYDLLPGSKCESSAFDEKYTRIGD